MSRKFLTSIDLTSNQLLNGVIHNLTEDPITGKDGQVYFNTEEQILKIYSNGTWQPVGDKEFIENTVADLLDAGAGIDLDYNSQGSSLTITNTGVLSLEGTENQITVSASAGDITAALADDVDIVGDLTVGDHLLVSGSASIQDSVVIDGGLNVGQPAFFSSDIGSNGSLSVEGDSVFSQNLRIKDSLQVDVDANIDGFLSVGASASFASDVEVDGSLTVHGDLNVDGLLNAINRTEINLEDNTIRLNSNLAASATPISDAGLIVERGSENNAALRWNETLDRWEIGFEDGSYQAIIATNDLDEDVEDIVANLVEGSNSLSITYNDNANTLTFDTVLQSGSPSYLVQNNGLAIDIPTLEAKLIEDSFTRKAAANVGNEVNTSFALVHGFDTRDVVVNVYDNATFDTVEVDVVRTDADTVTVTFAEAPDASAYRVVIIG